MNRIPLNALSAAVYELLSTNLPINVYDDVPDTAKAPFVSFGLFTCKTNGAKMTDISDTTLNIDIWSDYQGKKEVNTIANAIIELLSNAKFDLTPEGFNYMGGSIDYFEAFPEDTYGYHGVITMLTKIQNKGVN